MSQKDKKAWVVTVDMGYGHQRAAYPLRHLAPDGKILVANNYPGIPESDRKIWRESRKWYEFFSRLTNVPLIGGYLFSLFDKFQAIANFYPRRDLSAPTLQLNQIYWFMKHGWGRDLIEFLNKNPIPLIATFFTVAFFAEEHKYKGEIYCVVTDTDVSRTWVALDPSKSRIKYLAPCRRIVERLQLYGVKKENIFLTGFPLPEENLGGEKFKILKADLAERIINLDPDKRYRDKYAGTVRERLHDMNLDERHHHPLTVTFAVGGAGAQRQLGGIILNSLKNDIIAKKINFNLVAGTRNDVYLYFKNVICNIGLKNNLGKNLKIIYANHKDDYFTAFNIALRNTDILWTKPSELVFYCALGLPIVMAPPVGSQEVFNRTWLKSVGGGITQGDPQFAHEWLFDWVNSGWLAEAAMAGFLDGRQFGVRNIADVVFKGIKEPSEDDKIL
ncbi:MAG: hypothetical protein A2538_04475 [Candidatus Magasanikbacteria bacterium RIFOXYD2_FULL_41_14]|uniref:DUF6938 domain-containing protein n=1 Tax=Candidatus Magasanikbacteria bacterium RIFOXYD2_FULL_41_14 TaxID=1798709 RepID=A0A1F6PER7_9BACT|nr:MAG: hypothetical protein A2538_04475 [Candidatus Magasanikbacteria bacterium RIFOXYD2_FULL_41_14]